MECDYVDQHGAATVRRLEPLQLVFANRRWYLAAFDLDRDDWRTFRLDRVSQPRLTSQRFRQRPGPDPAELVQRSAPPPKRSPTRPPFAPNAMQKRPVTGSPPQLQRSIPKATAAHSSSAPTTSTGSLTTSSHSPLPSRSSHPESSAQAFGASPAQSRHGTPPNPGVSRRLAHEPRYHEGGSTSGQRELFWWLIIASIKTGHSGIGRS